MQKAFSHILIPIAIGAIIILAIAYIYLSRGKQPSITPEETSKPSDSSPSLTPSRSGESAQSTIVGFMGTFPSDFALAKSWGAKTVHWHQASGASLSEAITTAKDLDLNIMISTLSRGQIQGEGSTLDLEKVKTAVSNFYDANPVASDPIVSAFWTIDEPCHQGRPGGPPKWVLKASDLNDLYQTIKGVNPDIPIFINFGYLECLERFVNEAEEGWKLADVAGFTITYKKTQDSAFISEEAERAKKAKLFDPEMYVIPQLAVFEPVEHGVSLPSADWVRSTGLELAIQDSFDGILIYSFNDLSDWMGQTISVVKSDPEYISSFKEILGLY